MPPRPRPSCSTPTGWCSRRPPAGRPSCTPRWAHRRRSSGCWWSSSPPSCRRWPASADFTEVATEVLERWGLADRTDAVLAFWTRLELDQEVTALIRELRAAGAACWLATNQHELRRAYMSTSLGYDELLDGQLYSCDLGVAKPDPAYFTRAVAADRLRPRRGAVHRRPRGQRARRPHRRAAGRGLPPLLRRRRAARHPGGARPAVRAGTAVRPPRVGPGRAGCARGVAAQVHRWGRLRAGRRAGGPSARAGGWPAAGAAA